MRKTCLFLSVRVNYPIKFIIRSVEKMMSKLDNVNLKTESVSDEEMAEIIAENEAIESEMAAIEEDYGTDE